MPRYRNLDPQGAVVVPALGGRVVGASEVVDVPDPLAPEFDAAPLWRREAAPRREA